MFASAGKSLHIYSLERGGLKTVAKYVPKSNEIITQISWCHDNSYVAILQENEFPQILSTKDTISQISLVHTISSVPEVTSLKFMSNTKRLLALGTRGGDVMMYDTKNRSVSKIFGRLPSEIKSLEFNSTNDLAAIYDSSLIVFNVTHAGDSEKIELTNPDVCTTLKVCKNNPQQMIVGCVNGMVIVWDVMERRQVKVYHLHSAAITGIALSNKDKIMVTTGLDNKICVIDHASQTCLFKKILHQPISSIDISSNGQHMVAGLMDGSIYVYQMADHLKPQICSRMHSTSIHQISFDNGISLELIENDSILDDDTDIAGVKNISTHKENDGIVSTDTNTEDLAESSNNEIKKIEEESPSAADGDDVDVPEEQVKLDLMKLVNGHFSHLEDQLTDHCGKLQTLVSSELDSLYSVAARWECFKSMEMDDIVRYICGIVSASSETRVTRRSCHTNLQE